MNRLCRFEQLFSGYNWSFLCYWYCILSYRIINYYLENHLEELLH